MATFDAAPRDARLHAWLDGESTPEEAAEMEQWLRDHPLDAEQVRLWAGDGDAIRRRLDSVVDESVPMRLEQIVWNRTPVAMSVRWQRLAVASAIFVVGGVIGAVVAWSVGYRSATYADPMASSGWVQRAAVAHRVYAPESRHPVEVNVYDKAAPDHSSQEAHLSRWLTNRCDVPVRLFDLHELGYELVGGRLLPDVSGPSAQLMYQHASGQRITLYIRKPEAGAAAANRTASPFEYQRWGDLGLYTWVQGDAAYALVGDLSRERLLGLTEALYRQGGAPAAAPRS